MITFLDGILVEKQPTRVVLNVGGVGYALTISLGTYDRLPDENANCRILTHEHIREDVHDLYGFMMEEERGLFRLLLGVSGIGPKTAMSALSGLSTRELKAAIVSNDVKRLSSIPGIGKKTAERLAVELKDKFTAGDALEAISGAMEGKPDDIRLRDAILALISLGYKQADAQKMVKDAGAALPKAASVEDIVRRALAGR
jgi:holliday junction DNA helicase RuvA